MSADRVVVVVGGRKEQGYEGFSLSCTNNLYKSNGSNKINECTF